jgi:tetratricopeptide (TPR) repeat protein
MPQQVNGKLNGLDSLTSSKDTERIEQALADPETRRRLAAAIREALSEEEVPEPTWRRLSPVLASVGSALVMILAFFLPSMQDQWDRFVSRRVIQRHVELGRHFMREGKFTFASQAFSKALELSDNKRLDIEEEQLEAKVQKINENPNWGVKNPDGLEEADFLYLLQMQREDKQNKARVVTLNCYGVFLAAAQRWREAEETLREAIRLNPSDAAVYVNLGNLLRDRDRHQEAEEAYRTALRLDGRDGRVYYDLGLLLAETNRPTEAEEALKKAVALEPKDVDMLRTLGQQLEKNGKPDDARNVLTQLLSVEPSDTKVQHALQHLGKPSASSPLLQRQKKEQ